MFWLAFFNTFKQVSHGQKEKGIDIIQDSVGLKIVF